MSQAATPRRELTTRAISTGIVLGAILTPCNIYSGLKIGWSFNMSITSALLSFAFWKFMQSAALAKPWGLHESNINQTTASSAASIISGGLVAPIPALALVSGIELPWYQLIAWVFSVSFLGIWVAFFLLKPFLVSSPLPFPAGVATAQVITDIFAKGKEALRRVYMLGGAAVVASLIKSVDTYWYSLPRISLPASFSLKIAGASKSTFVSLKNLTFFLDPSPLLVGFGAIIGIRIGMSLLTGAVLAWGMIAPFAISRGWIPVEAFPTDSVWFAGVVEWLLWPGVALMVFASITSFAILLFKKDVTAGQTDGASLTHYKPGRLVYVGLAIASVLVVGAQMVLFDTAWWLALVALPMAFVFGVVAGRVVGETGIPPIGAIGQITQLNIGVLAPGQLVPNLTAANVAGGTAGQCADLLNDFKTGQIIGANPLFQIVAQCFGVFTGAIVGSLVYLALIPDPTTMLITEEWPAPAVLTWKIVAETLQQGMSSIPFHAQVAMAVGGILGILLALTERFGPRKLVKYLPAAPAIGLAFVIPASISIAMSFGAVLAFCLQKYVHAWSSRFLIAAASGLVAGESITGVISSIVSVAFG
ncbi:OPT family oligopeptide transporter [Kordiimonas lipolytica]|uniref:OPT family oligopeptide transporter n=1 Tax=Kordiimonas lipolytica TaxID=1662421 RepID=A0ABV8UAN0_9PROT|nr:OPT family oligopeptide transporter [Kordiimonas lipolytica]